MHRVTDKIKLTENSNLWNLKKKTGIRIVRHIVRHFETCLWYERFATMCSTARKFGRVPFIHSNSIARPERGSINNETRPCEHFNRAEMQLRVRVVLCVRSANTDCPYIYWEGCPQVGRDRNKRDEYIGLKYTSIPVTTAYNPGSMLIIGHVRFW